MHAMPTRRTAATKQRIVATIDQIEEDQGTTEFALRSRYPVAYAYDYLVAHAADFASPEAETVDRGAIGAWLREQCVDDDKLKLEVCILLADAHLRQHRLTVPPCE